MKTKETYEWNKALRICYRVSLSESALAEIQNSIPWGIMGNLTYAEMGAVLQVAILSAEMGFKAGKEKQTEG